MIISSCLLDSCPSFVDREDDHGSYGIRELLVMNDYEHEVKCKCVALADAVAHWFVVEVAVGCGTL